MRTSNLLIFGTALLLLAPTAYAEDGAAPADAMAGTEATAPEGAGTGELADPAAPADSEAMPASGDPVADALPASDVPIADALPASDVPIADALPASDVPIADALPASDVPIADALPASDDPIADALPASDDPVADAMPGSEDPMAEAVASESLPADADLADGAEAAAAEVSGVLLGQIGYDAEGRPGRIHVVSTGDTLWFISDAYLGTPWVWPSIWQDNQDIANPHLIYPGDHIWITPSEMRKITPEEAEALLAGQPAEGELTEPAAQDLAEVVIPGMAEPVVQAEQPKLRLSDHERVGLVSADVIDAAASVLANTAPRMMISQEDRIYIGLGAGDVIEGDQFTVLRVGSKVFDPETDKMLGYHVEFLGWVEVVDVDADASLAIVRESASEIAKGDRLVARRKPVSEILLGSGGSGVEGQISFLPNHRTEMGMLDYVYLNRGTLDGVEVGTPLYVYRKGFETDDVVSGRRRAIPDRVVADLVVVRSEPEASVAFVRHTEEELARGDYFRGAE